MEFGVYLEANDRQALVMGCLNDPADPMPRLVFADWLDEHDESQLGELIRLVSGPRSRAAVIRMNALKKTLPDQIGGFLTRIGYFPSSGNMIAWAAGHDGEPWQYQPKETRWFEPFHKYADAGQWHVVPGNTLYHRGYTLSPKEAPSGLWDAMFVGLLKHLAGWK